jgi:ABC-type multidrug transport system fused ATPase/permease subunit
MNSNLNISVQKKIWKILNRKQRIQVLVLFLLLFIGMLFEMLGIGILIPALGVFFNPNQLNDYEVLKDALSYIGDPSPKWIVFYGMILLVTIYLIKTIFLIYLSWRQSKFIVNLSTYLSGKMYSGYLNQPYDFHLQNNSSQIGSYVIGEVGLFSNVLLAIVNLVLEFTAIIGVTFVLFIVEPVGSLFIILFLIFFSFLFHRLTRTRLLTWGKTRQEFQVQLTKNLFQGLNGIKDILIHNNQNYFQDHFNFNLHQSAKNQIKVNTLNLIPRLYLEFLAILSLAGLIIFLVLEGKSVDNLIPTLGVFVASAFRTIPSANRIIASTQQIRYGQPAVGLIYNEINFLKENHLNLSHNDIIISFNKKIKVQNILFKYEGQAKYVLNNISFELNKGDSLGIIGTSGSGKSTLIDLILGLLTPNNGEILVDGINIFNNLFSWQKKIGYVSQVIYLTDDTLLRNIAFGVEDHKINNDAVLRAIDAAQLTEFVSKLEYGLATEVGERGVRLSGGQRQRIGIARALYHDPELLVLDEATSALDVNTETEVMQAIDNLKRVKTMIIVSHRLSTLKNCDLVIKLDEGNIQNS